MFPLVCLNLLFQRENRLLPVNDEISYVGKEQLDTESPSLKSRWVVLHVLHDSICINDDM